MFNISRNTLDLWLARQAETGSCRAKETVTKPKTKIRDWEKFREFVNQHGGKTQIEIAKLWGEGVTKQNISDAMKKIRVSRKSGCNRAEVSSACTAPSKRVTDIEKEMKSNVKSFKKN
jgi:hypothetical protein